MSQGSQPTCSLRFENLRGISILCQDEAYGHFRNFGITTMDIYNYLKKDHRLVADLMEQVVASQEPTEREALFAQIKSELTLHADTEEQTFYKAIEEASKAKLVTHEMEHAHHEHDEVRQYLESLSTTAVSDPTWIEIFGEFKHAVSHHVEEEEGDVFESAKKYLSDNQAKDLAKEMDSLKKQAKKADVQEPAEILGE